MASESFGQNEGHLLALSVNSFSFCAVRSKMKGQEAIVKDTPLFGSRGIRALVLENDDVF